MTTPETPVPAAPKRIPFVTDAIRLVRVLFSPGAVFEEQREHPTFWIPWVVVSAFFVLVTMLSMPFTIQMSRLAAQARGQPFPAAAESAMRIMAPITTPVVMLIMLVVMAGVMYLALLAAGGEVRYKGLLSVAVFTAPIGLLQVLLTFIVLKLRGPEALQTVADFQVTFGLDLLLPQDASVPKFVEGLLRGVSPFSLWSLALTAIGVRVVEKQTKGAAWAAAGVSFAVGLVIAALFSGIGGAR